MMNYWKARTARERLLISIAAGLAASVILLLVIWLPALQARKSAQLGAERAAKTLEAISRQSPIQASDNGSGTGDQQAVTSVGFDSAAGHRDRSAQVGSCLVSDRNQVCQRENPRAGGTESDAKVPDHGDVRR